VIWIAPNDLHNSYLRRKNFVETARCSFAECQNLCHCHTVICLLTSILAGFQSLVQLVITCGNDIVHELQTSLASILFLLHLNVHSTSKTRFNVF